VNRTLIERRGVRQPPPATKPLYKSNFRTAFNTSDSDSRMYIFGPGNGSPNATNVVVVVLVLVVIGFSMY